MSKQLIQLHQELAGNPYVTFDSDGNGVSRVFDVVWDFHALNQNIKTLSFGHVDEKYRRDIQSYLYALIQWQKKSSSSDSHAAVKTLISYRDKLNSLATRWRKSDFSLLSSEREWKRCSKMLLGVGGDSTCRRLASVINALNKAGLVTRYVHKREYIKWVNPDAGEGQAIAFPEAIHVSILKTVVEFVETYHPYRHQISEAMEKLYTYQDEMFNTELKALGVISLTERQMSTLRVRMSRTTRTWPERQAIPNFSFYRRGDWLGKVLRMCFICVGLFSAARKEELLSMNKDLFQKEPFFLYWQRVVETSRP